MRCTLRNIAYIQLVFKEFLNDAKDKKLKLGDFTVISKTFESCIQFIVENNNFLPKMVAIFINFITKPIFYDGLLTVRAFLELSVFFLHKFTRFLVTRTKSLIIRTRPSQALQ